MMGEPLRDWNTVRAPNQKFQSPPLQRVNTYVKIRQINKFRKESIMKLLIKQGRILDPATGTDGIYDMLIEDGKIKEVSENVRSTADATVNAAGCFVMPGFIDLHVHLREPGLTHKETIMTGQRAAARGGFTTICAMPNTKPVIDNPDRASFVHNKARHTGKVRVYQIGAVTQGQAGEKLSDIEGMVRAGVPAISEDGKSVMNAGLYEEAMKIAAALGIPVFAHCEDITMVKGGVINADKKANELCLPGITNAVEDVIVARDILLAKSTGVKLHLCHCSTRDSVQMVRQAKEAGIPVTAEVCPHHFTLTSGDIPGYDSNYKMNPPLRSREDVDALIEGLADGTLDVIATDHAPHAENEKSKSMLKAPFGIVGLETAAALTYSELVDKGFLTPLQMAEKMSYQPARVLNIERGTLAEGSTADLVIFDPEAEYTIDAERFESKGKNTPFHGRKVKGRVVYTVIEGEIV